MYLKKCTPPTQKEILCMVNKSRDLTTIITRSIIIKIIDNIVLSQKSELIMLCRHSFILQERGMGDLVIALYVLYNYFFHMLKYPVSWNTGIWLWFQIETDMQQYKCNSSLQLCEKICTQRHLIAGNFLCMSVFMMQYTRASLYASFTCNYFRITSLKVFIRVILQSNHGNVSVIFKTLQTQLQLEVKQRFY